MFKFRASFASRARPSLRGVVFFLFVDAIMLLPYMRRKVDVSSELRYTSVTVCLDKPCLSYLLPRARPSLRSAGKSFCVLLEFLSLATRRSLLIFVRKPFNHSVAFVDKTFIAQVDQSCVFWQASHKG